MKNTRKINIDCVNVNVNSVNVYWTAFLDSYNDYRIQRRKERKVNKFQRTINEIYLI